MISWHAAREAIPEIGGCVQCDDDVHLDHCLFVGPGQPLCKRCAHGLYSTEMAPRIVHWTAEARKRRGEPRAAQPEWWETAVAPTIEKAAVLWWVCVMSPLAMITFSGMLLEDMLDTGR